MGNVDLFELCETILKVQCKEWLLYWNQGIVYCSCGHLLRENQSSRGFLRWQLDLLSVPNYVIKKVRPHGNPRGKTEKQRKQLIAHNFTKRCVKKDFEGVHDRFQKDYKISWLATQNWSNWRNMHPDGRGGAERFHLSHVVRRNIWDFERPGLSLSTHLDEIQWWNSDQTSLTKMHRLHRESGEERFASIPFWQYQKWHPSSSSSSTSWWKWNGSWWSS